MPLNYEIIATCPRSKAKAGVLTLNGVQVNTPVFMPVGTKATIKGLTARQVTNARCVMILANTFHLCLRPGKNALLALKGVKKFSSWRHGLLTDSGGFQMVSLAKISHVSEEGVMFQSPYWRGPRYFSAQKSLSPYKTVSIPTF